VTMIVGGKTKTP